MVQSSAINNTTEIHSIAMKRDFTKVKKQAYHIGWEIKHLLLAGKKKWLVLSLLVLIVAAGIYFLSKPRHQEAPLPIVEVAAVDTTDVSIYGEYVGRIRAQQFVEVHARVEGYLEKMLFKEGSYIEKGQTLFVIDPKLYNAHVNRARAQLNKARAQARKADRDLKRIRPLYEQKAASQLDLDNAEAAAESANAEVTVCEADLTQAELTMGYTQVTSPISGYISERVADIGTLVGPSAGKSLLATVVKSDTVRVDFSMTALDYLRSKDRNVAISGSDMSDGKQKLQSYVTITLADGSEYPYKGLVDFADPQVDPKTGTFSVRAEMPNPDRQLLPGEFTKVKVLLDVRKNAIEIPTKAIVIEKGGAFVYVVRPDSLVEKRFVEVGPESGNLTLIERGLVKGERIVTEGYHKLSHGIKVNPTTSPAKEGKATPKTKKKED